MAIGLLHRFNRGGYVRRTLLLMVAGVLGCSESPCERGDFSLQFGLGAGDTLEFINLPTYRVQAEVDEGGRPGLTVGWRVKGISVDGYSSRYGAHDFDNVEEIVNFVTVWHDSLPTCRATFSGESYSFSEPIWIPLDDAHTGPTEFWMDWFPGPETPFQRGFTVTVELPDES
jgi:hypothetical protein